MSLHNIPAELRRLPQWVVTRLPDKAPLTPRTGKLADVMRPETWGTFDECLRAGGKAVGFVLSDNDPYAFIDLDNPFRRAKDKTIILPTDADYAEAVRNAERHQQILEKVDSYAELSLSGEGVHIVVKGSIPHGVRRDKVEVYSSERYMICTGNVLSNRPIAEAQELLDILFNEMDSTGKVELTEEFEVMTDQELVDMGMTAANGAKFQRLWNGDFAEYPSQSEADFALMSMIAYYSKANEQCRRVFRQSALGQRSKAQRDRYLNYMLKKIRAHEPPPVDLSELLTHAGEVAKAAARNNLPPPPPTRRTGLAADGTDSRSLASVGVQPTTDPGGETVSFPPGFVGELAEYFLASAIRPVPEIALASAIALTAGVVGRSYNVSGTGLNQYLILLAKTGSGKEGAASGIDAMVAAVKEQCPMADQFIGPAAFASGQALVRVLDDRPCFVSVLGEFGITLQQVCDPRAPEPKTMLKKVLLDLYAKSGWNKILRPSVYSDSEKNTKLLQAPNVTILGESTPETFYGGLDQSHILEGLIPRFSVIEYNGPRPPRNPNAFMPPDQTLVDKFADLTTVALATKQNNTCCPVAMDEDAQALLDEFDNYADDQINGAAGELERNLWNRAHLKALKLAALLAVGKDHQNAVITLDVAEWALNFVRNEVSRVLAKFTAGDVGMGESKQEHDIRKAFTDYLSMNPDEREIYKVPEALREEPVVPYHYLRRRLRLVASFKHDRRGHAIALDAMLEQLVKAEVLALIPPAQAWERYQLRTPAYTVGKTW